MYKYDQYDQAMVDTRVASSYVQLLQEYLVRQGLDPLRVLGAIFVVLLAVGAVGAVVCHASLLPAGARPHRLDRTEIGALAQTEGDDLRSMGPGSSDQAVAGTGGGCFGHVPKSIDRSV